MRLASGQCGWLRQSLDLIQFYQWLGLRIMVKLSQPASGGPFGLVVGGVALVSILSDESESNGSQVKAILWGLLSSVGFFTTFATGQAASVAGDELPVTLITRTVCIILLLGILVMQAGPKIPAKGNWLLLSVMGVLDAIALSLVMSAGTLYRPEFAAVAASTFGAITIILAWTFLKERMTFGQWAGVGLTFTGIGYLAL